LVSVLVSRASFAHVLLDAVGEGKMPQADISAFHARQIRSLNDAKLNEKLTRVGGELRDASDGQRAAIAKWKAEVTPVVLAKAEKAQGRGIDPYLKRNKVERVDEGAPPLRRFAP
jgi:hypothetical protein